jgi:hypothetical protein
MVSPYWEDILMSVKCSDDRTVSDILDCLNEDEMDKALLDLAAHKNNTELINIIEQLLNGKVFVKADTQRLLYLVKMHSTGIAWD